MATGASSTLAGANPAPTWPLRVFNWSMAAGRYTSVLTSSTFLCCFSISQRASLPAVVVLPAP